MLVINVLSDFDVIGLWSYILRNIILEYNILVKL